MALLLMFDDEDETTPIGVYTDSSAAMAAHACWDALEQDMRRERAENLDEGEFDQLDDIIAQMRDEYWLGFEQVRNPEHVNHDVDSGMGWYYTVRHVWVYGD